jgi:multimeric flavodoxin WrbA
MKIIGIVGSPRENGNTEILVNHALESIGEEGLDTELIRLAGLDIAPCNACMVCTKEERCSIEDDLFPIYLKMKDADGIILGSPVYYGSATALVKSFMERAGYISRHNGEPFRGKVGGPIVVARRAGHNFALAQLTMWFQVLEFVLTGTRRFSIGFGSEKGEVINDEEGMRTARELGKNMARVLKR